jgi:hypothetical protein
MKILNADPLFGRPLTENQIKDFLKARINNIQENLGIEVTEFYT